MARDKKNSERQNYSAAITALSNSRLTRVQHELEDYNLAPHIFLDFLELQNLIPRMRSF
jgi:hypothetical protein